MLLAEGDMSICILNHLSCTFLGEVLAFLCKRIRMKPQISDVSDEIFSKKIWKIHQNSNKARTLHILEFKMNDLVDEIHSIQIICPKTLFPKHFCGFHSLYPTKNSHPTTSFPKKTRRTCRIGNFSISHKQTRLVILPTVSHSNYGHFSVNICQAVIK